MIAVSSFRTRLAVSSAVVAISAGALAGSAAADEVNHVNLGDSFSAGSGVLPLAPGTNPLCAQSEANFAHDIAADKGFALTDVSCGGATTAHFEKSQYPGNAAQLDALSEDTDLVTMTIGGNDHGVFGDAVSSCGIAGIATGGKGSPCQDQHGTEFVDKVNDGTYPDLVHALRLVREKAPNARVLISGYPWLLPAEGNCFDRMPVAEGDVPYLRELQTTLNDAVRRAAAESGVEYVDQSEVSEGHDACQAPGVRWVEPAFGSTQFVPVHPNLLGERGMADQVMTHLD